MIYPDGKALDKVFAATVKRSNKAAISAVIFDEEKILYEKHDGLINREDGIRPDGNSLYMIASNTKVLTALGIMRLMEDGKLDLKDDIRKYIPEFSVRSRLGKKPMTIGSFLMHRSGLVCDLYRYMIADGPVYTDIIEGLKDTYRTSLPGEMFSYSNLGYTLLGIVIERISGMKYVEFMNKHLFGPLEMEVHYCPEKELPEEVLPKTARSYDSKGKRVYDPLGCCIPAGSCTYTSIYDLMKIGQLILNKGKYKGRRIYRKKTIRLMEKLPVKDRWDEELAVIGHGLFHHKLFTDYQTGPFMGHGGNTVYHHSLFDFLPEEKLGIIVFSDFENAPALIGKLEKALLNEYLAQAGFAKKEKTIHREVPMDVTQHIGKYDMIAGPMSFVLGDDRRLHVYAADAEYTARMLDHGWMKLDSGKPAKELNESQRMIRDNLWRQVEYFGKEVLLMSSDGQEKAVGVRWKNPQINAAWLEACGIYAPDEALIQEGYDGMELVLKDQELILTIRIIGEKLNYWLRVLNDQEAIVKGFGRNTGQTVTLKKDEEGWHLECDGVRALRKIQEEDR
ncbi:MAG: beta-lactamase family protein [Solobacterium sp.]|nr:beta-lactamase family protein [Solobacterium sp.]